MLCKLTLADGTVTLADSSVPNSKFSSTNFLHNGARIKGKASGATGIVYITPQDVQMTGITGTPASGAPTITLTDTGGIEVGMGVTGTLSLIHI